MKTLDEAIQPLVRTPGMSDAQAQAVLDEIQSKNESLIHEVCQNEHVRGLVDMMGYDLHLELNRIAVQGLRADEQSEAMSECVRRWLATAFGNGVLIGIQMERRDDGISTA